MQSKELQQQSKELQEQSRELQEQSKELQQLKATKNKLFSIIAHNLRSPFTGFLSLSQILAEEVKTGRKGTEGEPSSGLGLVICKYFIQ